jgi:hypothetical protein
VERSQGGLFFECGINPLEGTRIERGRPIDVSNYNMLLTIVFEETLARDRRVLVVDGGRSAR